MPFQWDESCQSKLLKSALSLPPILAYTRYQDPFVLTTDASSDSTGMVLSQVQNGKGRVIAYGAYGIKKFIRAEINYGFSEKKALAIILGILHFKPYLKCTTFMLITDHSTLKWMFGHKTVSGRIACWIAYMQQFNYTVEHKAGKSLGNAPQMTDCHVVSTMLLRRTDVELQEEDLNLRMTERSKIHG